jgi:hypothetical protein
MGCFKLAEKVSAQGPIHHVSVHAHHLEKVSTQCMIHHASGHAHHLDETQQ